MWLTEQRGPAIPGERFGVSHEAIVYNVIRVPGTYVSASIHLHNIYLKVSGLKISRFNTLMIQYQVIACRYRPEVYNSVCFNPFSFLG